MYKRIGYVEHEGVKYAIFERTDGYRVCGRYVNVAIFGKLMAWVIYGMNEADKGEPYFFKTIKDMNAGHRLGASWL